MTIKTAVTFLHCQTCLTEVPFGESPQSYARLELGLARDGVTLMVHCVRHDRPVVTLRLAEPVEGECACPRCQGRKAEVAS